ncbi:hypothetical protein ACFV16_39850 [Streptomyces massasporeus]|uniref:hypothetical protein n=1 Tax=Streptomyces massasporeus TaxID=67324 RepID=UPI0036773176
MSTRSGSALGMGTAAYHVQQDFVFTPPVLPRLRTGIQWLRMPDGVQFDGGPQREVLRGPAARELLPHLLTLLDGGRDVAGLAEAVGCEVCVIERVVSLLHVRGLLEEGGGLPGPTGAAPSALALARLGASTGVDRNAAQIRDRLAAAWVAVHGPVQATAPLADALMQSGVGGVVSAGPDAGEADLAVALLGPHGIPCGAAEQLHEQYARTESPFLPWFVAGSVSVIGPLLTPELDLCLRCLHQELGADDEVFTSSLHGGPLTASRTQAHTGLIVREILALLAQAPPPLSPLGATRYDVDDWTSEHSMPNSSPRCQRCRPRSAVKASEDGPMAVALRYHQAIRKPPRHRMTPKDLLQALDPRFVTWAQERRQWPSARLVHLPALSLPVTADQGSLDLTGLAVLLGLTAGLRSNSEDALDCWAPSAGNFGSPCLYLAACGIGGLADGVYGYDVHRHALALLGDLPTVDLLASDEPCAVVLISGDVSRLRRKYGPLALHLAGLDAGVTLAQIDFAAAALGRRITLHDDLSAPVVGALADACLIDAAQEPVTAVLTIAPLRPRPGGH